MKRKSFITLLLISFSLSALASTNLAGIRAMQMRSEKVVTVWLGYMATNDTSLLYNTELYTIGSPDDPEYKAEVHPSKIARFSKGSRSANGPMDWRALTDHQMHLYVDVPFKKGYNYYVRISEKLIPRDMPRTGEFNMELTPNPSFKLNQVGYTNTASTKYIYLSSYLGDGEAVDLAHYKTFRIYNASTGAEVLKGDVEWISDEDLQGKDKLYLLDISGLKEEGYFYAEIEGLGRSYVFQNGSKTALEIMQLAGRGMYFQRCGAELVPPYCGQWPRKMSHAGVYVTKKNIVHPWDLDIDPANPGAGDYYVPEGPREIHGGHHDAGDYDTRLTHLAIPEQFMSLYMSMPEKFHDGQIFIPENNNGIPDILDEAAWNLLHYEYLQDYLGEVRGEFGAIPGGMESTTHPPKWPTQGAGDALHYYMRKATPYTTFYGTAAFAQAARAFKGIDDEAAERYMKRALAGYAYAVKHRDEEWHPENPHILPLDWEEVYDEGALAAAWCWAAAQLFETTGEEKYMQAFKDNYKKAEHSKHRGMHDLSHGFWPITSSKRDNVDKEVQKAVTEKLMKSARELADLVNANGENGYSALCRNSGDWGFANPMGMIEIINRAYMLSGEQKYLDIIARSVDFTLGMNPSEYSWMTGAGTVHVMDPLHANSKFDGIEEPVPGLVIFGPTENWKHEQNPLYPDGESMGFYRRISDVWGFVRGCEFVTDDQVANMYWAAGLMLE